MSSEKEQKTVALDAEELADLIYDEASTQLGMSGEAFMSMYEAGRLPESPMADEVAALVYLAQDSDRRAILGRLCRLSERHPERNGHR